ncbi:MAG: MFS transporter, partial [Sphingomonas parapaucimobilis]
MARTFPPGIVHTALAVGGFAIGTTEFAAMSLEPDLARGLGIDAPTAGHVISAYALGVVVGAPLLAVLSAKLARRTLLIALMLMFAAGNGLSAMAPDYHWMLFFRFLSGLPHGAYFGIAALVAASLVPESRRTVAVGRIMLGLTVATVIGVPLAQMLGQWLNWRWVFGVVAALALLTATLVAIAAPHDRPDEGASIRRELDALSKGQVWLTLAIGAIGFGGMFAVYTYLAATLTEVTGASTAMIPLVLAVFGLGMTIGNIVVPRFADRALMPTAGGLLLWSAAMLALYPLAAQSLWTILPLVFAIGLG